MVAPAQTDALSDIDPPVRAGRGTIVDRVYSTIRAEVQTFGFCPWSDRGIGALVGLSGTEVGGAVGRLRAMGLIHDVPRAIPDTDPRFVNRALRGGGKALRLTPKEPTNPETLEGVDAERLRQEAAARRQCQQEIEDAKRRCHDAIELIRANTTIARRKFLGQGGATSATT